MPVVVVDIQQNTVIDEEKGERRKEKGKTQAYKLESNSAFKNLTRRAAEKARRIAKTSYLLSLIPYPLKRPFTGDYLPAERENCRIIAIE